MWGKSSLPPWRILYSLDSYSSCGCLDRMDSCIEATLSLTVTARTQFSTISGTKAQIRKSYQLDADLLACVDVRACSNNGLQHLSWCSCEAWEGTREERVSRWGFHRGRYRQRSHCLSCGPACTGQQYGSPCWPPLSSSTSASDNLTPLESPVKLPG